MGDTFSPEFYLSNRARLRTLFQGTAPIVITANALLQQGGDYTYKFYQDACFLYMTGINDPELILVIDKDKEYLIMPERSYVSEIFDGKTEASEFARISGIAEVYDSKDGWKKLSSRLQKVKHIATLAPLPNYVDVYNFYPNPARAELMKKILEINPSIEALDLKQHLAVMRMVKHPVEIEAIQSAIDKTISTIKEVKRKLPKIQYEYEIEAILNGGFRKQGADGHSFDPIVAVGKNACTLHTTNTNNPLNKNELLLLDVGAAVGRYAADVSRTISMNGAPTKRQKQVFDAVCEVQDFAYSLLKPGITIRNYEHQIEQFMGEKLRSLGLIRNVEHEEIRRFYPHSTSHYLGLDVHDAGDYDRPLEPGVVMTVEPGIYIPEEGIGVRIEDDVVITEDSIRIMTKKLSHEL